MKRNIKISALTLLAILLLACNFTSLFGETGAEEEEAILPNLTLTALFAPPQNIATITLIPPATATKTGAPVLATVKPTATEEGAATQIVVTGTQPTNAAQDNTATPTTVKTSTATSAWTPCYRSGERFNAQFFSTPPTIDGVWDEWTATQYSVTHVFYGANNYSGSADLGGVFRAGWDAKYLYIATEIADDVYVQNASGDDLYKGDSLEILLDTDLCGDFYTASLGADDFQVGISPGRPDPSGEKEAFLWFPSSRAGGVTGVIIAAEKTDNGYRVEAAIPWSIFNVTPWAGMTYGFSFGVSDNDYPAANVQQSMATSVATRRLLNPTTWGTIILKP